MLPPESHSKDIFSLLLSCLDVSSPVEALLAFSVRHRNPVLAVLAACFEVGVNIVFIWSLAWDTFRPLHKNLKLSWMQCLETADTAEVHQFSFFLCRCICRVHKRWLFWFVFRIKTRSGVCARGFLPPASWARTTNCVTYTMTRNRNTGTPTTWPTSWWPLWRMIASRRCYRASRYSFQWVQVNETLNTSVFFFLLSRFSAVLNILPEMCGRTIPAVHGHFDSGLSFRPMRRFLGGIQASVSTSRRLYMHSWQLFCIVNKTKRVKFLGRLCTTCTCQNVIVFCFSYIRQQAKLQLAMSVIWVPSGPRI